MISLREFAKQAMCGASHKVKRKKKVGAYLRKTAGYRIINSRSKRTPTPGTRILTSKSKRRY